MFDVVSVVSFFKLLTSHASGDFCSVGDKYERNKENTKTLKLRHSDGFLSPLVVFISKNIRIQNKISENKGAYEALK